MELVNVAIIENHHGKGLGKVLVMNAIQIAKGKGYKTIEIGIGNSNIGQLDLYQKCGFRIADVDKDFFIRHYKKLFLRMASIVEIWFVYFKIYKELLYAYLTIETQYLKKKNILYFFDFNN